MSKQRVAGLCVFKDIFKQFFVEVHMNIDRCRYFGSRHKKMKLLVINIRLGRISTMTFIDKIDREHAPTNTGMAINRLLKASRCKLTLKSENKVFPVIFSK